MAALRQELDSLFERDRDIDEVALQLLENSNFYLENHKLAISYNVARTLFVDAKASLQEDSLSASRAVLLVSADNYTAWNKRKRAVVESKLDIFQEIRFSNLILTKVCFLFTSLLG